MQIIVNTKMREYEFLSMSDTLTDISKMRPLGWMPKTDIDERLERYIMWKNKRK
jgi:nucleoside-diphosphate-sugar epimerase